MLPVLKGVLKRPVINVVPGLAYVAWHSSLETAHIWARLHTGTPTLTKSMKLICWSVAPLQLCPSDLVHLNFVWQQLAAAVDVGEDFLLQLGHLLPQQARRRGQVGVVAFQRFDLVLQPGDPLQFAPPTLRSRDPVPEPLPLGFDALLTVHVDGGGGKGTVSVE